MEAIAKLRKLKISPRKTRLVVDQIRNKKVTHALSILRVLQKKSVVSIKKLILSAVANWTNKHSEANLDISALYIKSIWVTEGVMMKRLECAAQGRGRRIRKRSNHITIIVATQEEALESLKKQSE